MSPLFWIATLPSRSNGGCHGTGCRIEFPLAYREAAHRVSSRNDENHHCALLRADRAIEAVENPSPAAVAHGQLSRRQGYTAALP